MEESEENSSSIGGESLPRIAKCRFAELSDILEINTLNSRVPLDRNESALRVEMIFEKACLSLVQENEYQEIVCAIFLCNYPNERIFIQSNWAPWINKLYNIRNATEENTLFIHLLYWDDRYEQDFFHELLTATFYTALCSYIILLQSPSMTSDVIRNEMQRIIPKSETSEAKSQVAYVGEQHQFIPEMKFRMVVEEDNDDVIQILDMKCKLLRKMYGDFYISEMMRHPEESRRIMVSEKENSIVAIICLNRNVDLNLLNDNFNLAIFGHLKKRPELIESIDDYEEEAEGDFENYSLESITEGKSKPVFDTNTNINDSSTKASNTMQTTPEGKSIDSLKKHTSCSDEDALVSDAFAIELLGHRDKLDELKSSVLLAAAFDCFPDLDYCLILLPSLQPHFPVLDNFVQVPLKRDRHFPMTLYATHRMALQGTLRVHEARSSDYEGVVHLLDGVAQAKNILLDFEKALKRNGDIQYRAYVFTCDDVAVGLAILCVEEEIELLHRYYYLEHLAPRFDVDRRAGRIIRLSIMPIFHIRLRFLLAELMRLEGSVALYYRAKFYSHEPDISCDLDVSPCISVMRSVEPRIRNRPEFKHILKKEISDVPFGDLFSLFVITPRLTMITSEIINTKIVVIGASICGLGFIDALSLGYTHQDLKFTDITLISQNGLPFETENDYHVQRMTVFRGRYCYAYRHLTSARASYNIIKGRVVNIDKDNKRVDVENCGTVPYDYLILTCGLLFQVPELNKDVGCDGKSLDSEAPSNCFTINGDLDAKICLEGLRKITNDFTEKKSVVFHGCTLECYCALGILLEAGLPGSWITLVEPKTDPVKHPFKRNFEIKDSLGQVIRSHGVKVMESCDLTDWTIDGESKVLKTILVENDANAYTFVDCDAFLAFKEKRFCMKTFYAIYDAGLVFNDRLIIDSQFRTKDRYIFAAGTMTKYSNKLRADKWMHEYYNSVEVGVKLSELIVNTILAEAEDAEPEKSEEPSTKPNSNQRQNAFKEPIILSCVLPGGYRYLHVRKPGIWHFEDPRLDSEEGDVFTTGSGTGDTGYFRLRLNRFNRIECITCFTKADIDVQNIISLYGKHEALFNDFRNRFLNSEIPDFYAYFSEPWTAALFWDGFDDFIKKCNLSCLNKDWNNKNDCKQNAVAELMSLLKKSDHDKASKTDYEKVANDWSENSRYLQEIESCVIDFVESHEDEFPMYKTARKEQEIRKEIKRMTTDSSDTGSEEQECICQLTL